MEPAAVAQAAGAKEKSKRTVNWKKKRPRPLDVTEMQKTVEQEKGVVKTPEKAAVSETGIRNSQMHTCQPLSISAENENTYRVRFQTENGTVNIAFALMMLN